MHKKRGRCQSVLFDTKEYFEISWFQIARVNFICCGLYLKPPWQGGTGSNDMLQHVLVRDESRYCCFSSISTKGEILL